MGHQYEKDLGNAVRKFWLTRDDQTRRSGEGGGTRKAVTGDRQMAGFVDLAKKVAVDIGVPEGSIFQSGNELPGYFRPPRAGIS